MLSGGERQRVALARALLPGPRVLLMDEAFSSLDSRLRDRIRQDTLKLLRENRTTAVLVTHDPGEAMRLADRIALLHEGRLVECASPEDLYRKPATLAAARFISDINELRGICRDGYVLTPLGSFTAPHLADQTEACVCIRPHSVRVAPRGRRRARPSGQHLVLGRGQSCGRGGERLGRAADDPHAGAHAGWRPTTRCISQSIPRACRSWPTTSTVP